MKIKRKMPLYIAVQLKCGDKKLWLPLPATKGQFLEVIAQIGGTKKPFTIRQYGFSIPSLTAEQLIKTPLSVVNHLASRLNKLSDGEILKLSAISSSDYKFVLAEQVIDYSYQTKSYTLRYGICDEEMLGIAHIGDPKHDIVQVCPKHRIDRREFGKKLARMENGVFTALGYLTSEIGWNLPPQNRCVPWQLELKDQNGEELYGDCVQMKNNLHY
jgi:hypothetical protein